MPLWGKFAICLLVATGSFRLSAQDLSLEALAERLERLERDNERLRAEIAELRRQLETARASQPGELEERVEIHERRIAEQAQTKVEASQRFPLRVTGMALFNLFLNSRGSGGADNPPLAARTPGPRSGGATLRQSVIGLQYQGGNTLWGGKVRGSLLADFFAGAGDPLGQQARIRTASIEIEWPTRSLLAGQEKAIFNPREPNSLAQVGVSPLTGAGNLWRWQPQVRFEQRFRVAEGTRLAAQVGLLQTSEDVALVPAEYASTVSRRRPGLEGRFLLSHALDEERRVEIAPGFHASRSQVAGSSVPSRLVSFDWFANPWRRLEFTGVLFRGQNLGHFGAPRQGFVIRKDVVTPVRSRGGWGQFTFLATSRLSFNLMAGRHDDRNADLLPGMVGKNTAWGANAMYRLAPNVVVGLEALQVRTEYLGTGLRINNHYDLALAYLF
ncbi:MAG: hypothetical protein RMK57_04080 [Bryobacterales bacterium]|nr:hypothetical protein [Bryobacteraceae bacterium]MDW8353689.1 hypothetical protein [Bryobacterales bacterium]